MAPRETLLSQLEIYEPTDADEAGHHCAIVNLLTSGDEAFYRGHFVPGHITASCYVIDASGRLLLHHHRRLQRWLQMGGHVEPGESAEVAALREGSEESGLTDLALIGGVFDLDVHHIPAGKGEPDHQHFDVRYLASTSAPDSIKIDRGESNELAWISLERAVALMNAPESTRVVRKIERLLAERSFP